MLLITPAERKVLLGLGLIIFAGSLLRFFGVAAVRHDRVAENTVSQSPNTCLSLVVNVNNASLDELQALPGIGVVTAQRIIAYRRQFGVFSRAQDLRKVKGIGEAKLALIRDYISF